MRTEHSYIQLGARTYDPEIGRFMSVDPLFELFPEHSPYHYCYNSPLVYADPSGMFSETETDLDGTIWLISYDIIAVYTPGIDDPLQPHGTCHNYTK